MSAVATAELSADNLPRLRTLARHSLPHVVEGTLIPLTLFYSVLAMAGIWGALEDPLVTGRAREGATLVNVGNMHTFAVLLRGRRMLGLFEHHTHLLTTERLRELVEALRAGTLDFEEVFAEDGHGAIVHPDYRPAPAFDFVAVTGPNRALARPLGWYEAVPHGDMMLAGPFGLIAATRARASGDGAGK